MQTEGTRVAQGSETLTLTGDLLITGLSRFGWLRAPEPTWRAIDISGVGRMDTAGAWAVVSVERQLSSGASGPVPIDGATRAQAALLQAVRDNSPAGDGPRRGKPTPADRLEMFGRQIVGAGQEAVGLLSFLGAVVVAIGALLLRPWRLRLIPLVHHMQEVGLNAVPIVTLMSFLIGVVLAFQGAVQLQQFGAEVFVVDLIAISVLRELGILLTAIIVAGRSGSAFTAALGSMKMREEIDALHTLGLDPIQVLVVPRVLALILMLPVLGFLANMAGLVGGAVMSWINLGVSPAVFQSRLLADVGVWNFVVGMIKAPFFALIVGIIGCYKGMQVEGNAESLGLLTSSSVVLSIFLVIVADALFSIFFAIIGV